MTLNSEQETRVRETVLSRRDAPRVDQVNFELRPGARVPTHVRVAPVPQVLVDIHPDWRGHAYFVVRDEIVVVDRQRRVVGVVPVGSSRAEQRGTGSRGTATSVHLSKPEIRRIQVVLKERGFYDGEPDGVWSPRVREALISFQRRQGFEATGEIDTRTVTALGLPSELGQRGQAGRSGSTSTSGQGADQPASAGRSQDGQQGARQGRQPSTSGQSGDQSREPSASGRSGDTNRQPSARQKTGSGQGPAGAQSQTPQGNPSTRGRGTDDGQNRPSRSQGQTPDSGASGTQPR